MRFFPSSVGVRLYLDIEICVAYNLFMIKTLEFADISSTPFPTR